MCFSFDFCVDDHETGPVENLGQLVFGERIRSSPYKVSNNFLDLWLFLYELLMDPHSLSSRTMKSGR